MGDAVLTRYQPADFVSGAFSPTQLQCSECGWKLVQEIESFRPVRIRVYACESPACKAKRDDARAAHNP